MVCDFTSEDMPGHQTDSNTTLDNTSVTVVVDSSQNPVPETSWDENALVTVNDIVVSRKLEAYRVVRSQGWFN